MYPAVAGAAVPAMHQKLPARRLWIVAGAAVVAVVVAVTLVVVLVRPTSMSCHFSCLTPQPGVPLVGSTVYHNDQFGYSVEYLNGEVRQGLSMSLGDTTPEGATFSMTDGSQIKFTASTGNDVDTAIQNAVGAIDSSVFRDMQVIGQVRGAEIGLVLGHGTAYKATFSPPGGGQGGPVGLIVMASSHSNVTITTVLFSPFRNDDVSFAPYGLQSGGFLDYLITLTHFPGS